MRVLSYTVRFVTPAFLGGADQSAQWRTPPFKALLRQWWRVAYAAEKNFGVDIAKMREEEGRLFGNAWLSHRQGVREVADYCRSLVRIRVDRWEKGRLRTWQPLPMVKHPELAQDVGSDLYLGYGPVTLSKGTNQPKLKSDAAIEAYESAAFSIASPNDHASCIERALWLMDRYGTLGGRCRNGWGSISLIPIKDTAPLQGAAPLRLWKDALDLDWPHAIGKDEKGPLIWQTKAFEDWRQLMRELAIVRIGLRTQFVFPNATPPHANIEARHWLSYPITKHTTQAWKGTWRLPNSLRFKIRAGADDPKKLIGIIFHVPCLPPEEFHPERSAIEAAWQAVHALLDELTHSKSARAYASISASDRRAKLRPQLDSVGLTRLLE